MVLNFVILPVCVCRSRGWLACVCYTDLEVRGQLPGLGLELGSAFLCNPPAFTPAVLYDCRCATHLTCFPFHSVRCLVSGPGILDKYPMAKPPPAPHWWAVGKGHPLPLKFT